MNKKSNYIFIIGGLIFLSIAALSYFLGDRIDPKLKLQCESVIEKQYGKNKEEPFYKQLVDKCSEENFAVMIALKESGAGAKTVARQVSSVNQKSILMIALQGLFAGIGIGLLICELIRTKKSK